MHAYKTSVLNARPAINHHLMTEASRLMSAAVSVSQVSSSLIDVRDPEMRRVDESVHHSSTRRV